MERQVSSLTSNCYNSFYGNNHDNHDDHDNNNDYFRTTLTGKIQSIKDIGFLIDHLSDTEQVVNVLPEIVF